MNAMRARRNVLRAGWTLLCALALGIWACESGRPHVIVHTAEGDVTIPVELAATAEMRAQGLMYRRDLDEDAGMLFVFPRSSVQSFWMKNTPLPLDMIFIGDDHRIVGIIADTTPFSTSPLSVGTPSRWVLEVHAGFSRDHGIRKGDRVTLPEAGS